MTLSNRIEQAAEGSRELDAEIAIALGLSGGNELIGRDGWCCGTASLPCKSANFTTSLDAAITLGDGLGESELWFIWNEALSACSVRNLDLRHDVARFWAAAALKARGL